MLTLEKKYTKNTVKDYQVKILLLKTGTFLKLQTTQTKHCCMHSTFALTFFGKLPYNLTWVRLQNLNRHFKCLWPQSMSRCVVQTHERSQDIFGLS